MKNIRELAARLAGAMALLAAILSLQFSAYMAPGVSGATTITVNSTADKISTDGFCTLREAIIAANKDLASSGGVGECPAGSGADTIVLPTGTYILTRTDHGSEDSSSTGDLDIKSSITISPTGPVTITAASGFSDRIFQVLSGTVTISGVTISNGNSSYGGAIYSAGNLTLTNSTLTNNKSKGWGGAIKNAGVLTLTNVTLSGNTAKTDGGGLYNYSGTATLTNVTIANNTADSDANGSGNGGGIARYNGAINIKNTLIGGNIDKSASAQHPDCSGSIASQGFNLIQSTTGCTLTGTATGNLLGVNPNIGPLQNNGGSTFTHALLANSPAIEAGTNTGCPATDQRGISRPQGLNCDMGAYEFENPPQVGPVFVVNTTDDPGDGVCGYSHCSLREAITAASARPNGATPDQITFNIAGAGPHTIAPTSALPAITDPVLIDGATDAVVLDGPNAGAGADGLTLNTSNSTVRNLTITRFGGDGVRVNSGSGNALRANSIFDNGGLGIDLGGDGATLNDTADADTGANNSQNFPVVARAVPGGGNITIEGRLNSTANTTFTLEFFASPSCDSSSFGEGQTFLGATTAATDATGDANFTTTLATAVAAGQYVTATATDPNGNTSEFSQCAVAGPGNDAWTRAQTLALGGDPLSASADQFIDKTGQSRWYKFSVKPGSKVIITLTNLPANYDLTLYKDIAAAYQTITSPQDLVRLGAEFAPDTFSPDTFSPDTFSPDTFSPDTFSPDTFSPDTFSPDTFSPDTFSPDTFSPDTFSPDTFSPDTFSPDTFSPDTFSPDTFSPDPAAFSSAQTRSLIGVSAFEGTSGEGISLNTWNNSGDFYVRVRGRNGVFSLTAPFHLQVIMLTGSCNAVSPALPATSLTAADGDYKTIILTDLARMAGTVDEKNALQAKLAEFANPTLHPEVAGVIVDVGADARVAAANVQADAHPECPYAKNLVASSIKSIVDNYWSLNPLEYVVIIGGDNAIPFFRYPDQALLANEQNYVPPVKDSTSSQASLKLGYVLSQDGYGARFDVSLKVNAFPLPGLAVGRLVETADEATTMLNAYLGTSNGVAPQPTSSLVTGYDFLEDAANAVQNELAAGLGTTATTDSLIAPRNISPTDPASWTAAQLETALLGSRHDLIYLAGHFSAGSTLAADYKTRLLTTDVTASNVNLTNSIVFSAGCHAGYNIVNEHGVSGVAADPDWAQAFARKGATLIAGTGYQYGDTDFIEYSERLYLEFSRQLRTGSGPVSVGKALVAAKQAYLAGTPQMRGIHEKALLEATLFGLPMLSVDMPGERLTSGSEASIVTSTNTFATKPGLTLGLQYANVNVTSPLTPHTVTLKDPANPLQTVTATYLSGNDDVLANPAEPVLPLELRNVTVANMVLRGVGFRGGAYSDQFNVLPLTGAPTTELRGIHAPAFYDVFYPIRPWNANYFDALVAGGATRLAVTPAQFLTDPDSLTGAGTLRKFSSMGFRLYYSNNTQTYSGNVPALSEPLSITAISADVSGTMMNFSARVTGEPAAGVQEVWVTYTALDGPFAGTWQPLDLTRNAADSTLWQGSLNLSGTLPEDVRFMVQAVNGVGLVTLMTNQGQYYSINLAPTEPTVLVLETPASTSGAYRTSATFSAVLTNNGTPLEGQRVVFSLGGQRRRTITDVNGRATVTMLLNGLPGGYDLRVSFLGTAVYQPSFAGPLTFTITKQGTTLTLTPPSATSHLGNGVLTVATLADAAGNHLAEETMFFVVTGVSGSQSVAVITDFAGQAALENVNLPFGSYTVTAYFSGSIIPGTLVLDDARYTPSTATGSLALINNAPSVGDDAYSVDDDDTLNVAAPGVLGNDNDPDGDMLTASLVSGPTHGVLTLNADGSFSYTPNHDFEGVDSFTYAVSDGLGGTDTATVTITVDDSNEPPDCSTASPNPTFLWPPNNDFAPVSVMGVTDPDGDPVIITITGVFQDERVGRAKSSSPDARILGPNLVKLRIERDGNGDGRVYHVYFTASDGNDSCSGHVRLGVVTHDQSNDLDTIDGGPLYDSTVRDP